MIGRRKRDLSANRLAALAAVAETPAGFRAVAELYRRRTDMLERKASRHEELEKRYAAAPRSLLAKRAHGWNTPARQRRLAQQARLAAAEARRLAEALESRGIA